MIFLGFLGLSALLFFDLVFLMLLAQGPGLWLVGLTQGAGLLYGAWQLRGRDQSLLFYLEIQWSQGEPVVAELWEEGLILLACYGLMIPGFLSDLFALLVLIPATRKSVFEGLCHFFARLAGK
ncbi:MAG: FxsA family protein [bacterium]|nr:FxsA family protein [bacterium]